MVSYAQKDAHNIIKAKVSIFSVWRGEDDEQVHENEGYPKLVNQHSHYDKKRKKIKLHLMLKMQKD